MSAEREAKLREMLVGAGVDPSVAAEATKDLAKATASLASQNSEHVQDKKDCEKSVTFWRVTTAVGFAGWAFTWWRRHHR